MEEKHLVFNTANYQMISNAAYFTLWLLFLELCHDPIFLSFKGPIWYQFTELFFFSSWTAVELPCMTPYGLFPEICVLAHFFWKDLLEPTKEGKDGERMTI